MNDKRYPLVSVAIITYNSSKTVIEALDSIYNQNYPNIEVIISDDCSKDNTVDVCHEWVRVHQDRFARVEIMTVDENTGVSGNVNRCWNECRGEWIKPLAGDDILMDHCVEDMVAYMLVNPQIVCAFSRMKAFGRSREENEEYMTRVFNYDFFNWSIEEQKEYMYYGGNCIPAPTSFFNREKVLHQLDIHADERIPMVEDVILWINMLRKNVQFGFLDKEEVLYRLSDSSLSTTYRPSEKSAQSLALIYLLYRFEPRYKSGKFNKLGEIRKYIHAANTAWGGWFWKTMIGIDYVFAKTLNLFGAKLKV